MFPSILDGDQRGFYEETDTHDPSLTVSYLRKTRVEAKSHSNGSHGVLQTNFAMQTNTYENETPVNLLGHFHIKFGDCMEMSTVAQVLI